jgi:hypothetical protein
MQTVRKKSFKITGSSRRLLQTNRGIYQGAALPDKRHEETESSTEEECMILEQGRTLSETKKESWDLDFMKTFTKR